MEILVTGASGYIGGFLCHALARAGHRTHQLDKLPSETPGKATIADLADRDSIRRVFQTNRFDAVVHLAGVNGIAASAQSVTEFFSQNIVNSIHLFNVAVEYDVRRVVFASSSSIYGAAAEIPIHESVAASPASPYAECKTQIERLLSWYDRVQGVKSAVLRLFNVGGASADGTSGKKRGTLQVIDKIIGTTLDAGVFRLHDGLPTSDGTAIRDYVHVLDVADAMVAAVEFLERSDESITANVGSGIGTSLRKIIQAIQDIGSCTVPIDTKSAGPGEVPICIADIRTATTRLQWRPKFSSVETIVSSSWAWAKHQRTTLRLEGETGAALHG